MAVAFDASGSEFVDTLNTGSITDTSLTIGANGNALIVHVAAVFSSAPADGDNAFTVTWDGFPLTKIKDFNGIAPANGWTYTFYLQNPNTGNKTLSITWDNVNNPTSAVSGIGFSVSGAAGVGRAFQGGGTGLTSFSVIIQSGTGNLVSAIFLADKNPSTVTATQLFLDTARDSAADYKAGASPSVTLTCTMSTTGGGQAVGVNILDFLVPHIEPTTGVPARLISKSRRELPTQLQQPFTIDPRSLIHSGIWFNQGNGQHSETLNTLPNLAFKNNVTAGNSIIVAVNVYNTGTTTPTISSPAKASGTATIGPFVQDLVNIDAAGTGRLGLAIYRARVTGSGSLTLSFTVGNATDSACSIAEFGNVGSVFDKTSSAEASKTSESDTVDVPAFGMAIQSGANSASNNYVPVFSDNKISWNGTGTSQFTYDSQYLTVDKFKTDTLTVTNLNGGSNCLVLSGAVSYSPESFHDAWLQQFSTTLFPKKGLQTNLQQAFAGIFPVSTVPPETITVDKWFQPLSERLFSKSSLLASSQQSFTIDPTALIGDTFNDEWMQPLSERLFGKKGLLSSLQQTFTIDPTALIQDIFADSWYEPFRDPIRTKPGLPAADQQFYAHPGIPFSDLRWLSEWLDPKPKGRLTSSDIPFVFTPPPAEVITVDKWFEPFSERLYTKRGLRSDLQQSFSIDAQLIQNIYAERWYEPLSEPVRTRRFNTSLHQDVATTPLVQEVITLDKWYESFSDPVKTRYFNNDLQQFTALTEIVPEVISLDKWYQPWPDFATRKDKPSASQQQFVSSISRFVEEQDNVAKWINAWPDFTRKQYLLSSLQQTFAYDYKSFQEVITLDKWINEWPDFTRKKSGLHPSNQQFASSIGRFVEDQTLVAKWLDAWPDFTRRKPGVHPSNQQFASSLGRFVEETLVSKWIDAWPDFTRRKPGLHPSLQQYIALVRDFPLLDKWYRPWPDFATKKRLPTSEHPFAPIVPFVEQTLLTKWFREFGTPPVRKKFPSHLQIPFSTGFNIIAAIVNATIQSIESGDSSLLRLGSSSPKRKWNTYVSIIATDPVSGAIVSEIESQDLKYPR